MPTPRKFVLFFDSCFKFVRVGRGFVPYSFAATRNMNGCKFMVLEICTARNVRSQRGHELRDTRKEMSFSA